MGNYLIRRLLLLPITLFFIILVNFVIVNLAPGDPVTITEISAEGTAKRKENQTVAFGTDDRYLQFREFYGLTLPILFNSWPWISNEAVKENLEALATHKYAGSETDIPVKEYNALRILFGDQSRFIMPLLLNVLSDENADGEIRNLASHFFARGGTYQAVLGPDLTPEQRAYNKKINRDNLFLASLAFKKTDSAEEIARKTEEATTWYKHNALLYDYEPSAAKKIQLFFFETRFSKYFQRVLFLDFGTMRNDANKTVISEVIKRFKYSLTLALIPMIITLFLCQIFGFLMAYHQNTLLDHTLNLVFLIFYAAPIFVVAPFLIENIALSHTFPFTDTPIPYAGFASDDSLYKTLTTKERLADILQHIFLPLVAIMYGSLAAQTRLCRTAVLEVLGQDYIRTAKAKGVPPFQILWKHVGRNAGITIVTSVASSLGVLLGGSLLVETLFEINGFGKFFYDAIINRDYNVIMFSTLAGSFLSLLGFLAADIAYTLLDPRVTLE